MGCLPLPWPPTRAPGCRGAGSAGWCCSGPRSPTERQAGFGLALATYSPRSHPDSVVTTGQVFRQSPSEILYQRDLTNPDKHGGSQWVDVTLRSNPTCIENKAKALARVRSAGTVSWPGFDRIQPQSSLLAGKHCRIYALDGVASTG